MRQRQAHVSGDPAGFGNPLSAATLLNYVTANLAEIPDRQRHGEPLATGFVESAVNQVVSKRLLKKQQMRWTPAGAHQLLQVRTRVLNERLRGDFERWHPRLQSAPESVRLAA
jgi:hypothetical protein